MEIKFDTISSTGVITLNRPDALNALNLEMAEQFSEKLNELLRFVICSVNLQQFYRAIIFSFLIELYPSIKFLALVTLKLRFSGTPSKHNALKQIAISNA